MHYILGSNGFVGQYLTKVLDDKKIAYKGFTSKELDLINPESTQFLLNNLKAEDTVIFLSCLTPDKGKDSATMFKNLKMADHVAMAIAQKNIAHLVYISSDAVYGVNNNPVSEKTPADLVDLYGYMHWGRELILKEACAKTKTPLCLLRPVGMFGKGDTHNSYGPNRFVKMAMEKKKISLFGGGEEKRDHLYVGDFAKIITDVCQKKTEGVLNIATGKAYSFMEVATILGAASGAEIENLPKSGGEITHKHFDITNFIKAFPSMTFKTLEDYAKEIFR